MNEEIFKGIAAQLRQPSGDYAIQVGEKMNEGNRHINISTIEALDLKKGDNILEIGMGNGFFVKDIVLAANTIRYTGCDYSEIMVEEATKQNEQFVKTGQVQFYLTSADHLNFKNETFDKVFSVNTIYFWDNHESIFSEIWRVLKPKGQLILSIRPRAVMEHYPFVKYGFQMFSKNELSILVAESNFKVITTIEKEEPEQEINGEKMAVETLIICAEKIMLADILIDPPD